MEQTAAENELTEDKYEILHKELLFNSFSVYYDVSFINQLIR